MTGYTYTTYVNTLIDLLSIQSASEPNFVTILPSIIEYAENRIQRDMDLLAAFTTDTTSSLTASNRTFTLPSQIQVLQQINVLTPHTATFANGLRNPLLPVTKEFLDAVYGSSTGASVPQYFAMINPTTVIVGPWPNQNYPVEIVGTQNLPSLYTLGQSNPAATTYISIDLPDLFMAASMVYGTGYQQNFGAQSDNPQMAQSWENQYQLLLKSADAEDERRKFASSGWTSYSPTPQATPGR